MVLQTDLQLLNGFARGIGKSADRVLSPFLPKLVLQKVADVTGVGEEVGVRLESVRVHISSAFLNGHRVTAGVGPTARLLQVAVGKCDSQTADFDIGEGLTGGVQSDNGLPPAGAVSGLPLNFLQRLFAKLSPFLVYPQAGSWRPTVSIDVYVHSEGEKDER